MQVELWSWPFAAAQTLAVQGWGYWLNIASFVLTIGGFLITYSQLVKTRTAARSAEQEAKRIESSLKRYDAAQEVSRATYALRTARKHFGNNAWSDGSESYEDVRTALIILKSNSLSLNEDIRHQIEKTTSYISKFCERVERGDMDNAQAADFAKAKSMIRVHEELLLTIGASLQKDVF